MAPIGIWKYWERQGNPLRESRHGACYAKAVMRFRIPRRLLLAGLLAAACYSPTLPLPPPVKPEITETSTGAFRISGGVLPEAQVFALNERNRMIDGQEVGQNGLYDFELTLAARGDLVQLWYQVGTELSPTTVFQLTPDGDPDAGDGGAGGQ